MALTDTRGQAARCPLREIVLSRQLRTKKKNKNMTPPPAMPVLQHSLLLSEVEKPPNGDPPQSIDVLNNPDEHIGNGPQSATEVAGPAGGGRQAAAMAAGGDGDGGGRKTFAEQASEAAQARAIAERKLREANAEVAELRQERQTLKGELQRQAEVIAKQEAAMQQKDAVVSELMRTLNEKRDEVAAVKAERQAATDAAVAAAVQQAVRDADAAAEARAGDAKRQADDAVAALQRELDARSKIEHPHTRMALAAVEAARARVVSGDGLTAAMRRAAEQHVKAHAGNQRPQMVPDVPMGYFSL